MPVECWQHVLAESETECHHSPWRHMHKNTVNWIIEASILTLREVYSEVYRATGVYSRSLYLIALYLHALFARLRTVPTEFCDIRYVIYQFYTGGTLNASVFVWLSRAHAPYGD